MKHLKIAIFVIVVGGAAILVYPWAKDFISHTALNYALIIAPFATLVASFCGPWFAYKFTDSRKEKDERCKQIIAGNTAIYILSLQFTALENIKRQFMDPVRSHPYCHLVMHPALPVTHDCLSFDSTELAFLLNTEQRDVLYRLKIVEDCFHGALRAFNEWSRVHRQEFQPRLEKAGFTREGQYSADVIESQLGPRIASELRDGATNAIGLFDHAIEKIVSVSTDLLSALKGVFPGEKFIRFEERKA